MAWGAIGARTTESQVHRELASGLSMPVGFKNGTDGDVQIAHRRACAPPRTRTASSASPSRGWPRIVTTRGNPDCHVILRGGASGPNYDATSVQTALDALRERPAAARA